MFGTSPPTTWSPFGNCASGREQTDWPSWYSPPWRQVYYGLARRLQHNRQETQTHIHRPKFPSFAPASSHSPLLRFVRNGVAKLWPPIPWLSPGLLASVCAYILVSPHDAFHSIGDPFLVFLRDGFHGIAVELLALSRDRFGATIGYNGYYAIRLRTAKVCRSVMMSPGSCCWR